MAKLCSVTHLKLSLFLALLFVAVKSRAQPKEESNDKAKKMRYDTTYITRFGDVVSVEPWISAPTFNFQIQPRGDSINKGSSYQPYLREVVGVDISYRAINFSVGLRTPIVPANEGLYGKTTYNILKFRINTSPYVFEFYHNNFKGFSDRNTPSYDSIHYGAGFVKRNDLTLQYTKFKAIYIFSHKKFSYGAAYSFTEKQKKSKGTVLAVAHMYRLKANADSSFFNYGQQGFFGKYDKMKHLDIVSMGIGPGYAVNFVFKKWFFSMGLYVVGDFQYHHANNEDGLLISEGWRGAVLADVFLSFGYNGNRFYSGFVARGDRNMVALPFVNASTNFYSSVFCIGFRFNPPRVAGILYDATPLKRL